MSKEMAFKEIHPLVRESVLAGILAGISSGTSHGRPIVASRAVYTGSPSFTSETGSNASPHSGHRVVVRP